MYKKLLFTIFIVLAASPIFAQSGIWYVNAANTSGTQNGLSWATAFSSLQEAINTAVSGNIWVAAGIYQPPSGSSFNLAPGVNLLGGFIGNETLPSERNWVKNITILKGNGNSVIYNYNSDVNVGLVAILDGFTITGGTGNNSNSNAGGGMYNYNWSPVINNCTFSNNTGGIGGGMYNSYSFTPTGSSAIINNCIFINNTAKQYGGGVYNDLNSWNAINNCVFTNNIADFGGGGYCNNSQGLFADTIPSITNCVFNNNNGGGNGGGIFSSASCAITNSTFSNNFDSGVPSGGGIFITYSNPPTITNCVFWGNRSSDIGYFGNTPTTISYCFTQTAFAGTGNITGTISPFANINNPAGPDGIFMTADDGLELASGTPPIGTGNIAAIPSGITTDITDAPRTYNGLVDMGAYENQGNNVPLNFEVCPPPSTTTITSNLTGASYQWQSNTGSGYINISDNSYYTGSQAASLQLNNLPSSWYGYQYRCLVGTSYSTIFTLQFADTWLGYTSNNWGTSANWSCGTVPDANTDVYIYNGTVVLTTATTIRSLTEGANSTVTVGNNLTITH